jgi:hypothetical protein
MRIDRRIVIAVIIVVIVVGAIIWFGPLGYALPGGGGGAPGY